MKLALLLLLVAVPARAQQPWRPAGLDSMRAWGSRYARMVYERCEHNKRQACRELGISYHTLRAYLRYKPKVEAGLPPAQRDGDGRAERPQRCTPESQSGGMQC